MFLWIGSSLQIFFAIEQVRFSFYGFRCEAVCSNHKAKGKTSLEEC